MAREPRAHRTDTILLLSLLGLAALFAVTGFATNRYHAHQQALAEYWYRAGEAERQAASASASVESFRTALVYSRDNPLYQLRLAQALIAANRVDEATSYLLNLWDREPENATVNLELGRLAARRDDAKQALRYYHNALYGDWEGQDAGRERRAARLEFYHFLLNRGLKAEAEAELVVLAANLPPDPLLYVQAGQLFLDLGDEPPALRQFQEALRLDGNSAAAQAGAGQAEFQMGRYEDARRHLERAVRGNPADSVSVGLLNRVRLVLSLDPLLPHLPPNERRERVASDFRQALKRLAACGIHPANPQQTPVSLDKLEMAYAQALKIQPQIRPDLLRRDADLEAAAVNLVFQVEETAAQRCGPGEAADEALLLVARQRRGAEK